MRAPIKAWLVDLGVITPQQPQSSRFQRVLSTVLFLAILGVPAFAWVQYQQAKSLERLTSQDFNGFEWDAYKLMMRALQLNNALSEAVYNPGSADFLVKTSTQYNLFVAQAQLIKQRAVDQGTEDEASFKLALSQSFAFIERAAPLLEGVPRKSSAQALRLLQSQADALRVRLYQQVIAAHDLRLLRSRQMIDEVARINLYFAALSAFVVVLGAGWALSAVRNLKLSTRRQDELAMEVEESSFSASHDFLTGLANRRLLFDQLSHAVAYSKRNDSCGALIMIDLDNFKPVNDCYGHEAGDLLLKEMARRIKQCVRDVDTVARVGGDEFVVLLSQVDGQPADVAAAASVIAHKLLVAVSAPCVLTLSEGKADAEIVTHSCTASFGVQVFSKDDCDVDELLKRADVAMYRAKQGGANRVEMAA